MRWIRLSDLFMNTTLYYVLAIFIYVYICITSILLISSTVRNTALELIIKLRSRIPENDVTNRVREYSNKFILEPIGKVLGGIFRFILLISFNLYRAEDYFTSIVLPEIVEPVNYASLILRKCYTDSQATVLTVTALFFVVFYFILSIF